jgi:hypothetical protein
MLQKIQLLKYECNRERHQQQQIQNTMANHGTLVYHKKKASIINKRGQLKGVIHHEYERMIKRKHPSLIEEGNQE